jgi:hypothetical protein
VRNHERDLSLPVNTWTGSSELRKRNGGLVTDETILKLHPGHQILLGSIYMIPPEFIVISAG